MANGHEYLFEVDVERICTASTTVVVRAKDKPEAIEKARVASSRTRFQTESTHYKPHNARPKADAVLPLPSAEEAYRQYVGACANDEAFDIATLVDFPTWQHTHAVEVLAEFFETYIGEDGEPLDEVVHDLHSQNASGINNGGVRDQIEFVYEQLGWEGTRKHLLGMVSETAEWPEEQEPKSEHDMEYDPPDED